MTHYELWSAHEPCPRPPGPDPTQGLRLVAALELASEHPLGTAIVKEARGRNLTLPAVARFESVTGQGVAGEIEGHTVVAGTPTFLSDGGVDVSVLDADAAALRSEGQTIVFAGIDGRPAGLFAIADRIKAPTREALAALRQDGIHVIMMTGDNRATAQAVATSVGIPAADVHAEVLPTDKRDLVRRLESQGRVVAMAGDGINDAPALAAASIGIAMGTGTDIAIESAGITSSKGTCAASSRASSQPSDDAQHPSEPGAGVRASAPWVFRRRWRALSVHRRPDQPDLGERRDRSAQCR
jgi:Cu+-exporting ATPase